VAAAPVADRLLRDGAIGPSLLVRGRVYGAMVELSKAANGTEAETSFGLQFSSD
jgi:hypothetical protein